ncbi:MAG: hypothetical protein ACOYMW_02930 [Candidatus Competibacteraceae bacterium]
MNTKSNLVNTKSISLTLSLLLVTIGIIPACSSSDLPAESLVIKGFYLGMSRDEFDKNFEKLPNELKEAVHKGTGSYLDFVDNKLTTVPFGIKFFGAESINPVFTKEFMDAYKIPSYFSKIVDASMFGKWRGDEKENSRNNSAISEKRKAFEKENPSHCIIYENNEVSYDNGFFCENRITGLSIMATFGSVVITKLETQQETAEKAAKNLNFK